MLITSEPMWSTAPMPCAGPGSFEATSFERDFKVFLLEDNPANAFVIECYLDELDLPPPFTVGTIAEAYAHKQEIVANAYDLVICDIMLPDGESYRFMGDLIANGFDRIALYSARGRSLSSSLIADFDSLPNFAKPLSFGDFSAKMARILDGD